MDNDIYLKIFQKIKSAKNILLVTHDRPDGDALSSECALIELLTHLNKKFFAYCYNSPPAQFNFLPNVEKINAHKDELNFSQYDLIITLDCGSLSRTKLTEEIENKDKSQFVVEFDHHPKIDDYADIEIKKPQASSTVEILYYFFKTNKIKINKNIANCILTGIITDTGNFLYPSTTDKTIQIASEMLLYGASFPLISESTRRNKSLPAMKILGRAIDNLQINKKYNFAFSVLTYKNLSEGNVTEEELEGISGFLSNLYGVSGVMLLREEKNKKIKGSLRTAHPKINISILAQILGGGGHAKASGFTIDGELRQVRGKIDVI